MITTAGEITRTAYMVLTDDRLEAMDDRKGGLLLSKSGAKKCPCCKSKDAAEQVVDSVRLAPYKEFFTSTFEVFECSFCGAEWSLYYPEGK